jgi:hypothetical protein
VSLTILWEPGAEAALLRIPSWRTAAAVDAGVIRFAETRRGDVERIGPRYRLTVAGHHVVFRIDDAAETLTVYGVYPLR